MTLQELLRLEEHQGGAQQHHQAGVVNSYPTSVPQSPAAHALGAHAHQAPHPHPQYHQQHPHAAAAAAAAAALLGPGGASSHHAAQLPGRPPQGQPHSARSATSGGKRRTPHISLEDVLASLRAEQMQQQAQLAGAAANGDPNAALLAPLCLTTPPPGAVPQAPGQGLVMASSFARTSAQSHLQGDAQLTQLPPHPQHSGGGGGNGSTLGSSLSCGGVGPRVPSGSGSGAAGTPFAQLATPGGGAGHVTGRASLQLGGSSSNLYALHQQQQQAVGGGGGSSSNGGLSGGAAIRRRLAGPNVLLGSQLDQAAQAERGHLGLPTLGAAAAAGVHAPATLLQAMGAGGAPASSSSSLPASPSLTQRTSVTSQHHGGGYHPHPHHPHLHHHQAAGRGPSGLGTRPSLTAIPDPAELVAAGVAGAPGSHEAAHQRLLRLRAAPFSRSSAWAEGALARQQQQHQHSASVGGGSQGGAAAPWPSAGGAAAGAATPRGAALAQLEQLHVSSTGGSFTGGQGGNSGSLLPVTPDVLRLRAVHTRSQSGYAGAPSTASAGGARVEAGLSLSLSAESCTHCGLVALRGAATHLEVLPCPGC